MNAFDTTSNLPVSWIHGRTGQQLEERTCPVGSRVRVSAEALRDYTAAKAAGSDGPLDLVVQEKGDPARWVYRAPISAWERAGVAFERALGVRLGRPKGPPRPPKPRKAPSGAHKQAPPERLAEVQRRLDALLRLLGQERARRYAAGELVGPAPVVPATWRDLAALLGGSRAPYDAHRGRNVREATLVSWERTVHAWVDGEAETPPPDELV